MRGTDFDASDVKQKASPFIQEAGCVEFVIESKKVKIQHLRLSFLLILLVYLVLYFSYISELEGEPFIVNSFFVSPFFVISLLLFVWFFMGKIQLKVEVYADRVLYPKLYFWKDTLLFDEMFNLENLFYRKEMLGAVIGKIDGGFVFFDKNRFESSEDFWRFERIVSSVVSANKNSLDQGRKIYVHGKSYSIYLVQAMFLIVWLGLVGGFYVAPSIEYFSVLELGALTKSVQEGRDIYRIFSAFFLHVSVVHVLSNAVIFGLMVDSLLRLVDTFRFLATFFFAAFIGSIVSLYLSPHEYVIGASGGIFGLFGAYCVVKFTKNLPGTVSQRSNRMVLAVIVLQVVTEYFIDGIDSYSHVGGFIAGALCMSVYLRFSKAQSIYKSTKVEKGLAVILTGAYGWGLLTFLYKVYV